MNEPQTTKLEIIAEYEESAMRAKSMGHHCEMLIAMMDVDGLNYSNMAQCALDYMYASKNLINKAIAICEREIINQVGVQP